MNVTYVFCCKISDENKPKTNLELYTLLSFLLMRPIENKTGLRVLGEKWVTELVILR